MTHQSSFSQAEFATKKKTTRHERFLARMEEVIPWAKLPAVIKPHYPKGERGCPPFGLERMLRVYFSPAMVCPRRRSARRRPLRQPSVA